MERARILGTWSIQLAVRAVVPLLLRDPAAQGLRRDVPAAHLAGADGPLGVPAVAQAPQGEPAPQGGGLTSTDAKDSRVLARQ